MIFNIFKKLGVLFLLHFTLLMSAGFSLWRTGASNYTSDDNPDTYPYFCNNQWIWAYGCFNKVELLPEQFIYFLQEELILLFLCGGLLFLAWKLNYFVVAFLVFFVIQGVDVLDYLIAYQKTWVYLGPFTFTFFNEDSTIGPYPLSWNIMKVVIFSIVIVNEALTLLEGKLDTDENIDN